MQSFYGGITWPPGNSSDEKSVNFIYRLPNSQSSNQTREIICRYGNNGDGFRSDSEEEYRGDYKLNKVYFKRSTTDNEVAEFKFRIYTGHNLPF